MLNDNDIIVLRSLAEKYAAYAALPVQKSKRALWEALNTFGMRRPLVLFDQLPWNELDVDGSLECVVSDGYWRGFECQLRRELYKWEHMPADMVLNPYLTLPGVAWHTGFGVSSQVEYAVTDKTSDVRAQSFECQFNCMEDVQKIKTPRLSVDRELQKRVAEEADMLYGGIIGWRFAGVTLHLGVWDWIAQYMGVTNVYTAIYDAPEMLHAMMERFTEGLITVIGEMNDARVFDLYDGYCHCSHTYLPDDFTSDERSLDDASAHNNERSLSGKYAQTIGGTSRQSWAFGLAQLFTSVSPAVTDEFEAAYMKRIFPYFGNVYYGCCDRLDDRMDVILKLPNVRKISCSPWSDADVFAEKLPRDRIMSVKPNPAFFAAKPFDLNEITGDLKKKLAAAKRYGCNVEFIFKDVSTVNYKPQNLWDAAKAAVELMENA